MYNIFCQRRTNVHAHCIIEEYCTFALCILIFTHHIIFGFRHRMTGRAEQFIDLLGSVGREKSVLQVCNVAIE